MRGSSDPDGQRGQSAVIGFVLMFGLVILLLTTLQVSAVPAWNQGEEFAHSQQVRNELELLRDDVTTAAVTGRSTSQSVTLGVRYPRRPFLLNPGNPAGRLRTTETGTVALTNLTAAGETGDYWNGSVRRFDTRHVVYRPNYNEYDDAPTTVYENSVLYDRFGERTLPLTGERVVNGRRITLVTIGGELSRSTTGAADVAVTPVSAPEQVVSVDGDGPVRLRLPTQLDEAAWNELLADEFVANGGHVYDNVTVTDGTPHDVVTITLEGNQTYDLRLARVQLGSGSTTPAPHYITADVETAAVSTGDSRRLVFEVRDRFNNPVSGVTVDTTVRGPGGRVVPIDDTTDQRGRAVFRYEATDSGTTTVEASFGGGATATQTATVRVRSTRAVGSTGDTTGPLVTDLDTAETTASGQSVPRGTVLTLSATATDFRRGGTDIYAAEWWSNRSVPDGSAGAGVALDPSDGRYDTVDEAVEARIDTSGWPTGPHRLAVRAQDANGNWGPPTNYTIVVESGDSPDGAAYDDANGNGRYDDGERTYTKADIEDGFDDTDVNLVVPADVGQLSLRGELRARSITLRTDVRSDGADLRLTAERDIDVAGQSLRASGKKIELRAGEGGRGRLVATDATVETTREIDLQSSGDVSLDGATVSAGGNREITADLGRDGATLFVDGTRISGRGDRLRYEPDGVTVRGTPANGRVVAD